MTGNLGMAGRVGTPDQPRDLGRMVAKVAEALGDRACATTVTRSKWSGELR